MTTFFFLASSAPTTRAMVTVSEKGTVCEESELGMGCDKISVSIRRRQGGSDRQGDRPRPKEQCQEYLHDGLQKIRGSPRCIQPYKKIAVTRITAARTSPTSQRLFDVSWNRRLAARKREWAELNARTVRFKRNFRALCLGAGFQYCVP